MVSELGKVGRNITSLKLKRLDHIAIVVESIEDVSKYFCELLGFEVKGISKSDITGDKYCTMVRDNIVLELVEVSERSPLHKVGKVEKGLNHIAYIVEDIEDALKKLREAGGQILTETVVHGKVKFNYAKLKDDLIFEVIEIPEEYEHAYQVPPEACS